MGHEAHVGLVDAHAEGDGGHHDEALLAQEAVLVALAHGRVQTGMVRQGMEPGGGQLCRHVLHLAARLAVHHPRVVAVGAHVLIADEAQQLLQAVFFLDDLVADVGPVEAADEVLGLFQPQVVHDVGPGEGVGRGGEGDARHLGETLVQRGQAPVFGPEVVAPLAHAVGLVDGKEAEQPALVQRLQLRHEARRGQALGRGVEQRQLTTEQTPLHVGGLVAAEAGVEEGGAHARLQQGAHLVVHERDQRRHDDRHPLPRAVPHDGRDLVAERLAAPGGHEHQRVAARADMRHDGLLRATEAVVAENVPQNSQAVIRHG